LADVATAESILTWLDLARPGLPSIASPHVAGASAGISAVLVLGIPSWWHI